MSSRLGRFDYVFLLQDLSAVSLRAPHCDWAPVAVVIGCRVSQFQQGNGQLDRKSVHGLGEVSPGLGCVSSPVSVRLACCCYSSVNRCLMRLRTMKQAVALLIATDLSNSFRQ